MKLFITILIAILSTSCFYNEKEENTIDEISAATNKVSTTNKISTDKVDADKMKVANKMTDKMKVADKMKATDKMADKMKVADKMKATDKMADKMKVADRMKATKKQKLSKEAIDLVKQFGNALKPALKKAIKTKGLEHAVEFCAVKAPEITKKINQQNKEWTIKRVSLKNRNPSAKPDNWERKVLKMFDKRQSNGESAKKMAYSEMVNGEFRFMKAQGVQGVCLSCHSKNIAKNIKSAIDKHYPNDKAIGYSLGQIRGAFSLSKKL
ncbi:hypothetical protein [uncultured Gammaproteobacteria bacterium]|jgi:hypothetical protein|nr:hypothetical protein [uncultured Gammaproteobacteria bacterium]CAC9560512.1 hypothetical protein [uncultured Gammaproteobacteria bacterium]CAC9952294.1 hypothetical protein [uncultured Gammaproteobacteria bacterium]